MFSGGKHFTQVVSALRCEVDFVLRLWVVSIIQKHVNVMLDNRKPPKHICERLKSEITHDYLFIHHAFGRFHSCLGAVLFLNDQISFNSFSFHAWIFAKRIKSIPYTSGKLVFVQWVVFIVHYPVSVLSDNQKSTRLICQASKMKLRKNDVSIQNERTISLPRNWFLFISYANTFHVWILAEK